MVCSIIPINPLNNQGPGAALIAQSDWNERVDLSGPGVFCSLEKNRCKTPKLDRFIRGENKNIFKQHHKMFNASYTYI